MATHSDLRSRSYPPDDFCVAPVDALDGFENKEPVVHGQRAFEQAVPGLENGGGDARMLVGI